MMNFDRKLRTRSRLLLALPAAALALSLAACGGASRPSQADVASGLTQYFESAGQGDIFDEKAADCFAGYLVDSELSNETLNYLANGEDKQANQSDKDLTTKILQDNMSECMGMEEE
ncbi:MULTISPECIES: hypothetical protein [Microbacterium]|jgi:Flp pilus assembly protein TadD|uniref:Uncharacterized protein n=1 Tax=Microbacterium galbinum TaxID=2851646 RepID=A0ABY4IPX7_9MICO|nr:hypothetical protein [Microbacterium galbinum]MCK2030633.1 hypothetical protein [Microbacterium galbinum]UPL13670.1 hypothetical protein KV396_03950 [Microbacterium galbinum]